MIELPFRLTIDFVCNSNKFNIKILNNLLSELQLIRPQPILKLHFTTIDTYLLAFEILKNYDINYTLLFTGDIDVLKNIPEDAYAIIQLGESAFYEKFDSLKLLKKKIIIQPSNNPCLAPIECLNYIKNSTRNANISLTPYLTEYEITNYTTKKNNRGFLTCATPWLNPIVDYEGNLYCCTNKIIGNIKNDSLLNLWNNDIANHIRENLMKDKCFDYCRCCLKKYTQAFLIVDNAKLYYNGNLYQFDSNINYVQSSPKVLIVAKQINDKIYSAIPLPIFDDKSLHLLSKKYAPLFLLE